MVLASFKPHNCTLGREEAVASVSKLLDEAQKKILEAFKG